MLSVAVRLEMVDEPMVWGIMARISVNPKL